MKTTTPLYDPPASSRAKLAAAWTSFLFLAIYIDYFHLYQPGEIDQIRSGTIFVFDISSTLMSGFFGLMALQILMILGSMALPVRMARRTNLLVASLLIPVCIFNAVGTSWDWAFYYVLTIAVQGLILAFILRTAWAWPRTASSATLSEESRTAPSAAVPEAERNAPKGTP